MADFSGGKGLHTYTVQEAVNSNLGKIVRVTPTLTIGSPTAFQNPDPFVNNAEIPNAVAYPGGTSRLLGVAIQSKDNEDFMHDILFHQTSGAVLGTVNPGSGTANISDSDFLALNYIGFINVAAGDTNQLATCSYGMATPPVSQNGALLLQADAGSTSVYFSCLMRDEPTLASTTDVTWIFHIEYK